LKWLTGSGTKFLEKNSHKKLGKVETIRIFFEGALHPNYVRCEANLNLGLTNGSAAKIWAGLANENTECVHMTQANYWPECEEK
jgi:hypothetical protein